MTFAYCPTCGLKYYDRHHAQIVCQCGTAFHNPTVGLPASVVEWPAWALAIKRLRKQSDTGIGDTVQRVAAWLGGELFKAFAEQIGIPCGCSARQEAWNTQYPYVRDECLHNP